MRILPAKYSSVGGKGFTFIELMIALVISGFVAALAMTVLLAVGAETGKSIVVLPAENSGQAVMDRIRFNLQQAAYGTVVVSDSGRRIDYLNPNLSASVKSAIYYDNNSKEIRYAPSVSNANGYVNWGKISSLGFGLTSTNALITVAIKMPAVYRGKTISVAMSDTLYVRN